MPIARIPPEQIFHPVALFVDKASVHALDCNGFLDFPISSRIQLVPFWSINDHEAFVEQRWAELPYEMKNFHWSIFQYHRT